jgi:hypothetical protein
MRLNVCSGGAGKPDPQAFYLNRSRLGVAAIVNRWTDEAACQCFEVRVSDGRHFVLRRAASGSWELAGVYRRG